jgi:hypothetical protein
MGRARLLDAALNAAYLAGYEAAALGAAFDADYARGLDVHERGVDESDSESFGESGSEDSWGMEGDRGGNFSVQIESGASVGEIRRLVEGMLDSGRWMGEPGEGLGSGRRLCLLGEGLLGEDLLGEGLRVRVWAEEGD